MFRLLEAIAPVCHPLIYAAKLTPCMTAILVDGKIHITHPKNEGTNDNQCSVSSKLYDYKWITNAYIRMQVVRITAVYDDRMYEK